MEITIKKTVCDVCGYSEVNVQIPCIICGKQMCWACRALGYNPIDITICKDCFSSNTTKKIIKETSKQFIKIRNETRDEQEKQLRQAKHEILDEVAAKRKRKEQ